MTDTIVRDVRGTWGSGTDAEGTRKTLYLRWTNQCGQERRQSLGEEAVVAMTIWLAQPKPPTPEETAAQIVEEFVNKPGQFVVPNVQGDLERRIATALRAAKEARDV